MKLIIYHGKHGRNYYDASTVEKEKAAYLTIFTKLYEWGCYDFPKEGVVEVPSRRRPACTYLVSEVLKDGWLAKKVLTERSSLGYEYETIEIAAAVDATDTDPLGLKEDK